MKRRISNRGLFVVLALFASGCSGDNKSPPDAQAPPDAAIPGTGIDAGATPDQGPMATMTDELYAKRYVAAGDRAYVIGSGDGLFPPMGWHIRGEMGGVWVHPIKVADGYWFAIDDTWLPAATALTAGAGHVRLAYPDIDGLTVERTELARDGMPAVLVRLTVRNSGSAAREVALSMDVRTELMASYPWGWTTPSARDMNGKDTGTYESGKLVFSEPDKPWTAVVAATPMPASGQVGDQLWGPIAEADQPEYLEHGNGTGGQLSWQLSLPAGAQETVWIAIAGSHVGASEAEQAAAQALATPEQHLADMIASRLELLALTQVELPDPTIQAAFDWSKLNLADLKRTVTNVEIRDVDEGRAYPEPVATLAEMTGIGAGFPDYPWLFGTDGAYTSLPLVVSGQWDTAIEHLRAIRDISIAINGTTGKVVHEVMTEGSVYFGNNEAPGNTNETAQFVMAVDTIWRWSGDDGFRDEMYEFVVQGMQYITSELDQDGDGWPEGYGMVERPGMGSEKLDVAAYTWQALLGLEHMALSKGDATTAAWARMTATTMAEGFEAAWWMPAEKRYADSLCNIGDEVSREQQDEHGWTNVCLAPDSQLQQRHWINVVPMEVGLAAPASAAMALGELEANSGPCGLYHTALLGGPSEQGELKCWTLPTSSMAVAEASYGRVRDNQALFYIRAIANLLTLETPGALPEIAASPGYDPFVDFRERAMFMQAWSPYGVQWPVIRYFLGIDPDMPSQRLTVVPDIPEGWPRLSVKNLRIGNGKLAVIAERQEGSVYRTEVTGEPGLMLTIGQALPAGAPVVSVMLDGEQVTPAIVDTLRGREVRVETTTDAARTLVVTTR